MRDSNPTRGDRRDPAASRRTFLKRSSTTLAGGLAAGLATPRGAHAAGSDIIRIGLVGCGGRGTGAAVQALRADPGTRIVAMADAFADQLDKSVRVMQQTAGVGDRAEVDRGHRFVGFDGYQRVIAADVDVVLLATPPHFRPMQLRACIEAGKHVFAEKPVAVDAPGVRHVLKTTALAKQKNLSIVSGLNGRYSPLHQETIERIHKGAIGQVTTLHAARYGNGVWIRPRKPGMTDMQYQMRNWYYFTWLSGDFNVEQFVHQLDRMAWVMQDTYPVRCYATGGRQARTSADCGHIYDHFSTVFEFAGEPKCFTTTRHQRGCSNESKTYVIGTEGVADLVKGTVRGARPWSAPRGSREDSHQLEQNAFFAALRAGQIINNGHYMANSTMMAIMSRMSAYTGQSLTWQQALNSQQSLTPSGYAWDATPPEDSVAVPGVTPFV